jgi:hypothetical protein
MAPGDLKNSHPTVKRLSAPDGRKIKSKKANRGNEAGLLEPSNSKIAGGNVGINIAFQT